MPNTFHNLLATLMYKLWLYTSTRTCNIALQLIAFAKSLQTSDFIDWCVLVPTSLRSFFSIQTHKYTDCFVPHLVLYLDPHLAPHLGPHLVPQWVPYLATHLVPHLAPHSKVHLVSHLLQIILSHAISQIGAVRGPTPGYMPARIFHRTAKDICSPIPGYRYIACPASGSAFGCTPRMTPGLGLSPSK